MKFVYEATTSSGEIQTGTVDGPSIQAATEALEGLNLVVLSIEEDKAGIKLDTEIPFLSRVKKQEIVLFSRQLAVLFDAQVPLLEALKALSEQTKNKKFQRIIREIAQEIDAGTSFSQALEPYPKLFSNFYVSVVRAGEASGRLQEVLSYLADHEEHSYDLTRKVRGALIYPAFIIFALIVVGIIMMVFVIPQITGILTETGGDLPLLTKIVIGISKFAQSWWWFLILVSIGGGVGLWFYIRTEQGRKIWDTFLLKIPILKNLFRKMYLARFAENLGTLIKGGIPIIQALTITGEVVGNTVYKQTIEDATEAVRRGEEMSDVLRQNHYIPSLVVEMVSVGERTGKLDLLLSKIASFYQKDVDAMVGNLTALIQPVLILVLGAAAGLLVAAILLPIYNLSSNF